MIIVSACLLEVRCRYDGKSCPDADLIAIASSTAFIPLCPEQEGGLPTPRPPARIINGTGIDVINNLARVVDSTGTDVTERFLRGAEKTWEIAKTMGVRVAVMKERSPSCGVLSIRKNNSTIEGMGVTSALLMRHGVHIISSDKIGVEDVRHYNNRK